MLWGQALEGKCFSWEVQPALTKSQTHSRHVGETEHAS